MCVIEDLKKVSVLGAFLFKCLAFKTYGCFLFWEDFNCLSFCLRCTHKKKKGYTEEVEKIFLDYIKFKGRKSLATGQAKRSVLLQAIKKSPYIEVDESRSNNDEKWCCFTSRFGTLLSRALKLAVAEEAQLPKAEMELDSLFIAPENSLGPSNNLENSTYTLSLKEDNFPIYHDQMFAIPLEEDPQEEYADTSNLDSNSPSCYINSFHDENFSTFDISSDELLGNQVQLLSEAGPNPSPANYYMVTVADFSVFQKNSHSQNLTEGLKGYQC